jgi:hypothetical protein
MPVFTLKEFEKRSKASPSEATTVEQSAVVVEEEKEIPPAPILEHVFFYPDNRINGYHNGTYKALIKEEIIEVPIVDGVIKVKSLELKEALINEGFTFLRTQEVVE